MMRISLERLALCGRSRAIRVQCGGQFCAEPKTPQPSMRVCLYVCIRPKNILPARAVPVWVSLFKCVCVVCGTQNARMESKNGYNPMIGRRFAEMGRSSGGGREGGNMYIDASGSIAILGSFVMPRVWWWWWWTMHGTCMCDRVRQT